MSPSDHILWAKVVVWPNLDIGGLRNVPLDWEAMSQQCLYFMKNGPRLVVVHQPPQR